MEQLIERVLTVRAGFAPDNRTSLPLNPFAFASDVLPVGFHVALLEIGGESAQILIVR